MNPAQKQFSLNRAASGKHFPIRIPALHFPPCLRRCLILLAFVIVSDASAQVVNPAPDAQPLNAKTLDAYDSWKLALAAGAATDPATFTLLPGFRAELVRSATPGEGSWVAMAFDPQGRLTLAREKRGLIRLALDGAKVVGVEVIDDTLLECRGLLYALGALFADANNSKTLCRLRDADDDGKFEEITELLRTEGGVGHGRNHLKLGPDGKLYVAHGNNVRPPAALSPRSPVQFLREDQLIPCQWDATMFDGEVLAPAGHILRLDPDGKNVELFACGFRNPLDIAFNDDGEMFTFDADMEYDVGVPWYMPNRVLHVVSGADFGFRRGTGRSPAWRADTLPAVLDIGLASPTAVIFGKGAAFPAKYQRALFVCDWAYGRILAVHLTPRGASYTGVSELFAGGRPLNVTDVCIGPDGAMWFITGGRGTQSGLYRLTYTGPALPEEKPAPAAFAAGQASIKLRGLRHRREKYHTRLDDNQKAGALNATWATLGHADRFVRHASRIALEHFPIEWWEKKALAENDTPRALTALLALARAGDAAVEPRLLARLARLPLEKLDNEQLLAALRIYALTFSRLGAPDDIARAAFAPPPAATPVAPAPAAFVKAWTLDDFLPLLDRVSRGRSFEGGKLALVTAQCIACHRVSDDPTLPAGTLGPDLRAVAARFNRRDLLDHNLNPSKVVDEKYRATVFTLDDKSEITGTIEHEDAATVIVRPSQLAAQTVPVEKPRLTRRAVSAVSPMPPGLLDTLHAEQVLDLLAFLEAGGNPKHAAFQP